MAAVTHIYFLSKFVEFLDTIFFILRKKFRNVSNLQLIHHGLMPFYCFLLVRWVPGGKKSTKVFQQIHLSILTSIVVVWMVKFQKNQTCVKDRRNFKSLVYGLKILGSEKSNDGHEFYTFRSLYL